MIVKIITGTGSTLGVIFIMICAFQTGYDFSKDAAYSEPFEFENKSDTLYIETTEDPYFSENLEYDEDILFETVQVTDGKIIFGYPELKIKRSTSDQFEMTIEREAHGSNKREAIARAEAIHYKFSHQDSLLKLAPYFSTPIKNKLRLQKITITVFVPEGKTVYLGDKINRIYNEHNHEDEEEHESSIPVNTYLKMTDGGLMDR